MSARRTCGGRSGRRSCRSNEAPSRAPPTGAYPRSSGSLFGGGGEVRPPFDLREAAREAFAFGVDEGGGARARHCIGGARRRNFSGERRIDHAQFDRAVVGAAALV